MQASNEPMSQPDAMDHIEKTFTEYLGRGMGILADKKVPWTIDAARVEAGYEGSSYIDAVDALARKFRTRAEIQELPRRVARRKS